MKGREIKEGTIHITTPLYFNIHHEPIAEHRQPPHNNLPGIIIRDLKITLGHAILLLVVTSHPGAAGSWDDSVIQEAGIH